MLRESPNRPLDPTTAARVQHDPTSAHQARERLENLVGVSHIVPRSLEEKWRALPEATRQATAAELAGLDPDAYLGDRPRGERGEVVAARGAHKLLEVLRQHHGQRAGLDAERLHLTSEGMVARTTEIDERTRAIADNVVATTEAELARYEREAQQVLEADEQKIFAVDPATEAQLRARLEDALGGGAVDPATGHHGGLQELIDRQVRAGDVTAARTTLRLARERLPSMAPATQIAAQRLIAQGEPLLDPEQVANARNDLKLLEAARERLHFARSYLPSRSGQ